MMHFLRLLCSVWLLICATSAVAKSWQNIVPLQTTRSEVLNLFGSPKTNLKDKSEYFDIDNQTVTFRWTRADCSGEVEIIDEKLVKPDSLVYQITVEPNVPLQSIDSYTSDITKVPVSSLPGFWWHLYSTNCISNTNGQIACSSVSSNYGFGYSSSNKGFTALYFFPTNEEVETWKEKQKPC